MKSILYLCKLNFLLLFLLYTFNNINIFKRNHLIKNVQFLMMVLIRKKMKFISPMDTN